MLSSNRSSACVVDLNQYPNVMLRDYPVLCTNTNCQERAVYKIASEWSDGTTHELKTYALACEKCLNSLFVQALGRHWLCRIAAHETLAVPGIYQRGSTGSSRRIDLELHLTPEPDA